MYNVHAGAGGTVQLTHEQLDGYLNENCVKMNQQWVCCICNHASHLKTDITRHVESKHVTLPTLFCQICNKPAQTYRGLAIHMKTYHSQT